MTRQPLRYRGRSAVGRSIAGLFVSLLLGVLALIAGPSIATASTDDARVTADRAGGATTELAVEPADLAATASLTAHPRGGEAMDLVAPAARRLLAKTGNPPGGTADDIVRLNDYINITAKRSQVRNVQTNVGRSSFERGLIESGFNRSVLTTIKNVVQYELGGARYVVRDAAISTGGPTADFYSVGFGAFTLKIRLGGP